jgi:hypothetical protein
VYGKVKAFHGRLIDISTPGAEMTVDVRKAANKINSRTDHRLYYTIGGRVKLVDTSMFEKLQASITNRGIMKTLFRAQEIARRRILKHSD